MACRNCRFFSPQFTASGRIKHAAGQCAYQVSALQPLPSVIDQRRVEAAINHRSSAWPGDNEGCPTYEAKE